jgi:CCR4-NOT transcription complex subunit 6
MMYNFQHQTSHQQHAQHHPTLQQDHNTHATNGSVLGHHSSFSGVLSNSTPSFTPTSLQNGHSAITRGGQSQQITEHWAEQLQLYKESQRAHTAMVEGHAPHHYARIKASENRGISSTTANATTQDGEAENHGRTSKQEEFVKRQDWNNMDLSGQGLRVLATPLFKYTFLTELYVASNKITHLPATIGHLRLLRHLDASSNQLAQLPPELGMCVYLKNLLLFDNNIQSLPNELGSLFQLEILGIEGNPLNAVMKQAIMEKGTKALINELRESTPSKPPQRSS